jgi:hypothetical protein
MEIGNFKILILYYLIQNSKSKPPRKYQLQNPKFGFGFLDFLGFLGLGTWICFGFWVWYVFGFTFIND